MVYEVLGNNPFNKMLPVAVAQLLGLVLLLLVMTGVALINTEVVPAADVQLFNVAVTLYIPLAIVATFEMVGF